MQDIFAIFALDWVFDKIGDRFGLLAAWLVTGALAIMIMVAAVWVLKSVWS
jgi:hypothetical protein